LCGASGLRAQQAPAAGGAQEDAFLFTGDAGVVIFQVKPTATADFEAAWGEIKTKLSASDKPDLKTQGESIKIFKMNAAPAPDQPVGYLLSIESPVKASYNPVKILYAQGGPWDRAAADAAYKKIAESVVNISVLSLTKVSK
jgi:hypothetical protein